MGGASNKEQPAVIEQTNASEMASGSQITFRVAVNLKGSLSADPSQESSNFEWSIITDPIDVDGPKNGDGEIGTGSITESESSDEERDEENAPGTSPIDPGLLKRYKYTSPTQSDAIAALKELTTVLRPHHDTGSGYKDLELDLWCHAQVNGMVSMLNMFTNAQSITYNRWSTSAYQTAIGMGRGAHCVRRLCELNHAFLTDHKILPINPYGDWNKSLLVNENIVNEVSIYLLSLRKNEFTAKHLMDFLHRADIKGKYGIERNISHKTACRYLHTLGYRYQSTPKGQYVDGHEREDVITYQEKVFLPKWKRFAKWMAVWDKDLQEHLPTGGEKRVIAWFHNESVFYAHDRWKNGWYHKDSGAKPYTKGEGPSLMITDFVSADFGWLSSPDQGRSA